MATYHINPETGDVGRCSATKGGCPYGSLDEHYTSAAGARKAYEASKSSFESKELEGYFSLYGKELSPEVKGYIESDVASIESLLETAPTIAEEIERLSPLKAIGAPPIPRLRAIGYSSKSDFKPGEFNRELKGDFIVEVYTRQGGGNRECYCSADDEANPSYCSACSNDVLVELPSYLRDEDDTWDSTYATFYFDPGVTTTHAEAYKEACAKNEAIKLAQEALKHFDAGEIPAWALNEPEEALQQLYQLKQARAAKASAEELVSKLEVSVTQTKPIAKKLASGKRLSAKELATIVAATAKNGYEKTSFRECLDELQVSREELAVKDQAMNEATALPEGPLRTMLLGDRGTGSYRTTEGKGRNARSVVKAFQRGSLLGEELNKAKRDFEHKELMASEPLKRFGEACEKSEGKLHEAKESIKLKKAEESKALASLWQAGWKQAYGAIPPIPKDLAKVT